MGWALSPRKPRLAFLLNSLDIVESVIQKSSSRRVQLNLTLNFELRTLNPMSSIEEEEQPRKRVKLSEPEALNADVDNEARVGITAYVNPDLPGFTGVFKQRYGKRTEDSAKHLITNRC